MYCLSCLHSFRTKTSLSLIKIYVKIFCSVTMPSEEAKILKFNQHENSDKAPSTIYTDPTSLIEIIGGHKCNLETLSTTKVGKYIPCGYSLLTIRIFDDIENKYNVCRGESRMKKFCESFREHAINKRTKGIV